MRAPRTAFDVSRCRLLLVAAILVPVLSSCTGGGGGGGGEEPDPPTSLEALVVSSSEVDLVWSYGDPPADSFRVERSDGGTSAPGPYALLGTVPGTVTLYSDSGLQEGVTYWYRVVAVQDGKSSAPSNAVAVSTNPPPACLVPPENLSATGISTSEIHLAWTDESDCEEGYRVERAPDDSGKAGAFAPVAELPADSEQFDDSGLQEDEVYWYRLRAVADGAASAYSKKVHGQTLANSPTTAWTDTIELAKSQSKPELILEEDGRSYLRCESEPGNTVLIALEADGSLRWQRELLGLYHFARASDGALWMLTDGIYNPPDFGLAAGKLSSSDGTTLWERAYGCGGSWKLPESPNAAPQESVEFNSIEGTWGGACLGVVGPDGSLEWDVQCLPGIDPALCSNGDRILCVNQSQAETSFLARIGPDGAPRWQQWFYQSGGSATLKILEAFECLDGGVGVFGAFDIQHTWIAKLDSNGMIASQTTLTAPVMWTAYMLSAADESGERYIAQGILSSPWVYALSPQGELRWQRQVDTPAYETITMVVPRPSGGCFLVGWTDYAQPANQYDTWVVALDEDGTLEWERSLDIGQSDYPLAAGACEGGALMVAGNSYVTSGGDPDAWVAVLSDSGELTSQAAWVGPDWTHADRLEPVAGGGWRLVGFHVGEAGDVFLAEIDDSGSVQRSVRLVGSANLLSWLGEASRVGVGSQGELHLVSAQMASDFEVDMVHGVIPPASATLLALSASSCAEELAYSPDAVSSSAGVATALDPSSEITSTVFATQLAANLVTPGVLSPATYSGSGFPGSAQIVSTCKP